MSENYDIDIKEQYIACPSIKVVIKSRGTTICSDNRWREDIK